MLSLLGCKERLGPQGAWTPSGVAFPRFGLQAKPATVARRMRLETPPTPRRHAFGQASRGWPGVTRLARRHEVGQA
jgi:hypothetical protein